MGYQPELLATCGTLEELKELAEAGCSAFLLGEEKFGMRLPGEFTPELIREAVDFARPRGIKIYACVNNLMDNEALPALPEYLKVLGGIGVDGIEFGDPSVLMQARALLPGLPLHWNAEMTSTNHGTANYWGRRGATRVVLARELNMDEVTGMMPHLEVEAQVQVHGMTNIYHSKRSLVHSYMANQGRPVEDDNVGLSRGLYLIEAERRDERFPIYEDSNGTHIMSSGDICILEDLHLLMEAGVQSFKIEGILKSAAYNVAAARAYRKAIDTFAADPENYAFEEAWLDEIRDLQDPQRELSFGFFYKEQVY
ncbi:peptidase U32 family protein [Saccharibacillus sp. CPCC 101409]|uniref:peptidase U32 family protein n=1 Tax=Saccharibacillus sp. CPCC 101409 TaxID=3058041 RepID=UPI0026718A07|nr:peptidase U32 family protein [Saccharibacillus sp. CPCC 101409]MDO3409037.1 peptidase U32 family protein [Saccharibacillus sp. CPCC 101409]